MASKQNTAKASLQGKQLLDLTEQQQHMLNMLAETRLLYLMQVAYTVSCTMQPMSMKGTHVCLASVPRL